VKKYITETQTGKNKAAEKTEEAPACVVQASARMGR